jgi:hypothetical protein
MSRYGYLQAIPMSFYSSALYREVGESWNSDVILYLMLLLIVCWLPAQVLIQMHLSEYVPPVATFYAQQIPVITIKNGIVSTPEDRPYLITNKKEQIVTAIIDTSGKHLTIDKEPDSVTLLLTKTEMITRNNDNIKIHKLSSTLNQIIDPQKIKIKIIAWVNWLWVIIFPVVFMASLAYRLLQALFYAAIGKIYSLMIDIELSYTIILRLAIVAVTPAIILKTVLTILNYQAPALTFLYFAVAIGYLIFAIHANENEQES